MGEVDRGKKQGALGTTGRRKDEESLLSSPFPAFSALSFTLSPNCLHGQKGKRPLRRRELFEQSLLTRMLTFPTAFCPLD